MSWGSAGLIMSALGAVNSIIGGYFAAKSQRYQLKSQAKTLEFQQSMSQINARIAETEAVDVERLGIKQAARASMTYGAAQSAERASLAARGIDPTVGSAAESMATMEFAKRSDMATINANAVRAAEAQRMQALNYRTQAMMQGVSAQNLMATRRTIRPEVLAGGALLESGGMAALNYQDYLDNRYPRMRRR
jgi:hypothetical protein